jgi:hypothetical protein
VFQRRTDRTTVAPSSPPTGEAWEEHAVETVAPFATGNGDPSALLPWIDALGIGDAQQHHETPRSSVTPPQVAQVDRSNRPSNWHTIASNTILEGYAPQTIELPLEVVRGLDAAQRASEKDGNEHGGNIVRKRDQYAMRPGGDGTPGSFDHDEKNTGGKTFTGVYHTHPMDETTGQFSGFSGDDIANMTTENRNVSLMRADDTTRMLARTKEFEAKLKEAESPDALAAEMQEQYEAAYQAVLGGDPRNHYRAVEHATRYTTRKYHLLYYSGKGAELGRVGGRPK